MKVKCAMTARRALIMVSGRMSCDRALAFATLGRGRRAPLKTLRALRSVGASAWV